MAPPIMPLNFRLTSNGEIRRFLTTFLFVSLGVTAIGLAGGFVLVRRVEAELLTNQTQAAEREAAVIARFIDRDFADGATPSQIIARLQSVLKGTGSQADFLCVLDGEGRVLSHPNSAMIGMHRGHVNISRVDTSENLPISEVLRSRQPFSGLLREPNEPTQLAHYQPVSREPWTIAVHKNAAAIASQFAALRWQLFGTAAPTLLLISFVGVALARSLGARFEQELAAKNATLETRVRDRTADLTKALGELQSAHERLLQGEKMHLLGELMAGIAHEINNPLTTIGGFSEMIAQGGAKEPRETAAVISQQARRVSSIVRNLLDFAQNRPVQHAPGSITDVLHSAEELIAADLRLSGIALETYISPDLPRVLMDKQQMEQVFINLIRNAAQALASQRGERRITVRSSTQATWVAVLICDNGPGVPAHLREQIFGSFVTTKSDGTGLGLSLCKRFVESHGGRIELLPPADGEGACFQIQLPAINAALPAPLVNSSIVHP